LPAAASRSRDLLAAGFRIDRATAWVEEGVLAYLSGEAAGDVLATVTAMSASGSRLLKSVVETDLDSPAYLTAIRV
jgi:O-methyltransferase involved in polyketide biosynthesis